MGYLQESFDNQKNDSKKLSSENANIKSNKVDVDNIHDQLRNTSEQVAAKKAEEILAANVCNASTMML